MRYSILNAHPHLVEAQQKPAPQPSCVRLQLCGSGRELAHETLTVIGNNIRSPYQLALR